MSREEQLGCGHSPLCAVTHPIGSFLVKVRFRLGLAWLMGMVEPWKKHEGCQREGAPVSHTFPLGSQTNPGAQGRAGSCLCPDAPTTQMSRRPKLANLLCIMGTSEFRYGWDRQPTFIID